MRKKFKKLLECDYESIYPIIIFIFLFQVLILVSYYYGVNYIGMLWINLGIIIIALFLPRLLGDVYWEENKE